MRSQNNKESSFKLKDNEIEEEVEDEIEDSASKEAPVEMSPIGHTLIYPRRDNIYKKKEALPFDEAHSNVWKRRKSQGLKDSFKDWFVYLLIGLIVGIIAFGMDQLEDFLVDHNCDLFQYIINRNKDRTGYTQILFPWMSYCGLCILFGTLSGLMTTYYGPGAAGSGVAEMIGYMNGVNYPNFIGVNTLLTKILGVVLAVSGRLCIGKEGPLGHIGSIVGVMVPYIPGLGFEHMRNDKVKRELIAAGGSAGVAAAFGAPIGGALFAYEMSKSTNFWSFQMLYKTFVSCSFGVIVLGILQSAAKGFVGDGFAGSTIKFGANTKLDQTNTFQSLLGAVIIGIVGGCLGALFISVNFKMNVIRKRLLKTKWIKVIETGFWCALTASAFVLISYFSWKTQDNVCEPLTNLKTADAKSIVHQGWCPEGQFDPNISLYFATEGGIIRNIMNKEVTVQYGNLCVFLLMWYLFTITTYGTNVPAGLFLPGMIIGCALGAFIFRTMDYGHLIIGDQDKKDAIRRSYIILGCGGFMAGYTRMTYSLAVIIMETSNDIQIFMPMMVTIGISNFVGYAFTRSLYERAVRGKQMPVIKERVPAPCCDVRAEEIMCKDLVCLQNVDSLENIKKALTGNNHHSFPVLNSMGNYVGLIPRNFILVLLEERHFYGSQFTEETSVKIKENFDNQIALSLRVSSQSAASGQKLNYQKRDSVRIDNTLMHSQFSNYFDITKYPPTPPEKMLDWTKFTRDFWSVDVPVTTELLNICQYNAEAQIDFRPYIIENPVMVLTTDNLPKCADYYRKFHLRHLAVIHPSDGSIRGIITRQDLFKWLDS